MLHKVLFPIICLLFWFNNVTSKTIQEYTCPSIDLICYGGPCDSLTVSIDAAEDQVFLKSIALNKEEFYLQQTSPELNPERFQCFRKMLVAMTLLKDQRHSITLMEMQRLYFEKKHPGSLAGPGC